MKGPFRVNNSGHAEGQHGGRGWEEGYWGTESGASGGLGSINSCMWAVDWGGEGDEQGRKGEDGVLFVTHNGGLWGLQLTS